MTEKYEAIGWQVTRHQFAAECGPCLEATNAPGASHYDVMLVGHMDTVFPVGTAAKRPLKVEGNQAFGPGVSDMKSGLLSTVCPQRDGPGRAGQAQGAGLLQL